MKKKLLFTAVVVAAMSGAMVPVLALQNATETEAEFMAGEAGDAETSDYIDVTADFVVNASCTENYGWNKDPRNNGGYNVTNPDLTSDVYDGTGIEFWKPNEALTSCDLIYQDITGLPNGNYRLTAFAMGCNQGGGDICDEGLYLFANGSKTAVTSNKWGRFSVDVEVENNTLKIGLCVNENNKNNWVAISQVVLEGKADALLSYYQNKLQSLVTDANALGQEYEIENSAPKPCIEKLKGYKYNDKLATKECKDLVAEINQYIEEAKKLKTALANIYLPTKENAERLLTQLVVSDDSKKTNFERAISDSYTSVMDEISTLDELKAKRKTLLDACRDFYASKEGIAEGAVNLDMTPFVVVNPGFDEKTMDGWICNQTPDLNHGMVLYSFNKWYKPTFDFYQEVVNVPNGKYCLSVQEHASIGNKTELYIQSSEGRMGTTMNWNYADDVEGAEKAWAVDEGISRVTTGEVVVVDGKIRIGVNRHTVAEGLLFFDNFRLVRVSDGAEEIQQLYNQKKEEANAFIEENDNVLLDVLKTSLESALDQQPQTVEQWYAAYNNLNTTIENCKNSMPMAYEMVDLINECQSYYANSIASGEAKADFLAKINDAKKYKKAPTVEDIQKYIEPLETARREFVEQAVPTGDVKFDMTYLIKNPDVTGLPRGSVSSFGWVSSTDSWSNNFNNNGDPSLFYESYQNGAFGAGTWVLYQPVHMTAGYYKMTLKAFGMNANGAGSGPLVASVYAGETKGESITDGKTLDNTYGVNFNVSADCDMNLGVRIDEGNGANWVGANDMKLYKLAPETLRLDEKSTDYNVESDTYTNVTVDRVLKAGKWNTFCVPFAMTAEQLAENKITDVRKLEHVARNGESVVLNFSDPVTEIEAGVPYIVEVGEQVDQITVNGVVVKDEEPQPLAVDNVVMLGNYASMTITGDKYFISNNKFYRAAGKPITVDGFRAYITFSDAQAAGINTMFINIDGEVTAIDEAVEDVSDELVNVYTMNGVCVKAGVKASEALNGLQRGAYIVNGKKVIK